MESSPSPSTSSLGSLAEAIGAAGRGAGTQAGTLTRNELRDLLSEYVEHVVELETDCRHFVVAVKLHAAAEGSIMIMPEWQVV